jgi:hypothetical protein
MRSLILAAIVAGALAGPAGAAEQSQSAAAPCPGQTVGHFGTVECQVNTKPCGSTCIAPGAVCHATTLNAYCASSTQLCRGVCIAKGKACPAH